MTFATTKALLLSATQAANRKMMQTTKIPPSVAVNEITLSLNDGITLAGQRWTYQGGNTTTSSATPPSHKILALHGWLDNCASFHYLAPHLVSKMGGKAEIVALDLPGHGWSSHKSLDGPATLLSEGVFYVAEALDKLGWTRYNTSKNEGTKSKENSDDHHQNDHGDGKVTLIGHSMGGGLSLVYAAAFPELVDKLVLLDIYSPMPGESEKTTSIIRSHIEARKQGARGHRVYESFEQAIKTRRMTAAKAPGKQWLSLEAATEMVTRAMKTVDGEGYIFRHDTRLLWPSMQYLMPDQIDNIMKSVECPVCILAAENGWPFKKERVEKAVEILEPSVHKILPGSHHLHADPDSAETVLEEVYHFVDEKNMKYVL
jgi:pimeloyl-ACP methyl ester carboxylesterase